MECLNDLALIRTTLETLALFSDPVDTELKAEMRPSIEDARRRLIQRLQKIDRQVTDGSSFLSDGDLQRFHRAMIDVIRRGVSWSALDRWVWGSEQSHLPASGRAFHYSLALRHRHDDPCNGPATALLRRILEDLIDELSTETNLHSAVPFERAVYLKFQSVIFACLGGEGPIRTDNE